MIARRRHGLWRVLKERFTVVLNVACLAVHELTRTDNIPAKRRAYGLMSQAHAQYGPFAGKVLDQLNADARLLRRTWSWRNQNMAGPHLFHLMRRDLITQSHLHLLTQLAQILHQVVGKGIVVVEDEDHGFAMTSLVEKHHLSPRNLAS